MDQQDGSGLHRLLRGQAGACLCRMLETDGPSPRREEALLLSRFRGLADAGLTGIIVPEELEGEGGGWAEAAVVVEETAAAEPVLAMMLTSHLVCAAGLLAWAGPELQRELLPPLARGEALGAVALTEPEAGTDFASLKAVLKRRGDSCFAEGNKCFVTNATGKAESCFLIFLKGRGGIAAACVSSSAPGLHLAHRYRFSGWEGLPNHALVLEDCEFPAGRVLREGLAREDLLPLLDRAALLVAAAAAGMARACLEEARRYASGREQGGKRLAGHQALRFRLADMALFIELVRSSLQPAAARMDAGEDLHLEACMLKLFATGGLEAVASSAVEMAGGYGYTLDSRLSSLYRDAKGLQLFWGSRELMRLELARALGL